MGRRRAERRESTNRPQPQLSWGVELPFRPRVSKRAGKKTVTGRHRLSQKTLACSTPPGLVLPVAHDDCITVLGINAQSMDVCRSEQRSVPQSTRAPVAPVSERPHQQSPMPLPTQPPKNKSQNWDVPSNANKLRHLIATIPNLPASTQHPMKRLLLLALTAATLLSATTSANAHCDGKHGHQDTDTHQGVKK